MNLKLGERLVVDLYFNLVGYKTSYEGDFEIGGKLIGSGGGEEGAISSFKTKLAVGETDYLSIEN